MDLFFFFFNSSLNLLQNCFCYIFWLFSSLTRDWTHAPWIGRRSLNHRANFFFFNVDHFLKVIIEFIDVSRKSPEKCKSRARQGFSQNSQDSVTLPSSQIESIHMKENMAAGNSRPRVYFQWKQILPKIPAEGIMEDSNWSNLDHISISLSKSLWQGE